MKIGIIWEYGVSKYITTPFEELIDKHEIIVFVGKKNKFDTSLVKLKKIHLDTISEYKYALKQPFKAIKRVLSNPYKKMNFFINSLEHIIDDSFDIIISGDLPRTIHTLAQLKDKKKFKYIVSYAQNIPFCSVYDKKMDFIKQKYFDKIDIFLPWCKTIEKCLLQEGVSSSRIKVMYEGVNTDIFYPRVKDQKLIDDFNLSDKKFTFSYVGKLVSWKGIQYILYAANLLKMQGINNFQILLTGKGAQLENLKQIIKQANLEDIVFFTSFLEYKDISRLFSIVDVLLLPSIPILYWQEQYGMVIVESFACSKPVIASKSGSIEEIISDGGLLFTPGNWYELAEQMIKIMNDKNLYNNLVENTKRLTKEKYSMHLHAEKLDNLFIDMEKAI